MSKRSPHAGTSDPSANGPVGRAEHGPTSRDLRGGDGIFAIRVRAEWALQRLGADPGRLSAGEAGELYSVLTAAATIVGERYLSRVGASEGDLLGALRGAGERAAVHLSLPLEMDLKRWLAAHPQLSGRAKRAVHKVAFALGLETTAEFKAWVTSGQAFRIGGVAAKTISELRVALGLPAQEERPVDLREEMLWALRESVAPWRPGDEERMEEAIEALERTAWRVLGEGEKARWARGVAVAGPLRPSEQDRAERYGLHVFSACNSIDGGNYTCIGEVTQRGSSKPGLKLDRR